jgi:MFS family permease
MFRWPLIRTQEPRVSIGTIIAINLLWFSNLFQVFVTANALVFTVKHFTDDTRLIALTTSIGAGFSFLVGPICNYLSDRIWTRIGRRRPFIILGWSAVGAAMALIPLMPSYGALITLVIAYTLLGDIATPVEPLCMEVVPPAQRARSMSVRLILIQACSLFYFQVLFPRFDSVLHLPQSVPLVGGFAFTGEQLIYAIASFLFFSMVAFLLFFVRETKVETAPNLALKDLKFSPIKSTKAFLFDTFGDSRWLWIYLLYCCANAYMFSWSSSPLYTLLLTDQFGYSKADVAHMGLPTQLFGALVIHPVMGWYGDRYPRLPYSLLAGIVIGAFGTLTWLAKTQLHLATGELPDAGWLLLLGGLAIAGYSAIYLMCAQTILRLMGQAGARVWIYLVSLVMQVLLGFGCWMLIRYFRVAHGIVPPIFLWFILEQARLTLKSCTDVITMPMFFDFVPRDKMGTLSSGFGFTNGLLVFLLTNFVGSWIQWFSGSGPKDYSSGYLLQLAVGALAFAGTLAFIRTFKRGRIAEYGRLGLDAHEPSPANVAENVNT